VRDQAAVAVAMDESQTVLLTTKVHAAFGTDMNDILIMALALGVRDGFGVDKVALALEGHGREPVVTGIDVSRTVGWFTSLYPVVVPAPSGAELGRQIKETKEILHRVPNKGIGFGILKQITPAALAGAASTFLLPRISFNYLGQFDAEISNQRFNVATSGVGRSVADRFVREFELDVSAIIANRCLSLSITYGSKRFRKQTIESLLQKTVEHLERIVAFCCDSKERELTPSDLDFKELSIDELDSLLS
jgi:non-ribosomal peptide synthase protein (TIGR01720 family)